MPYDKVQVENKDRLKSSHATQTSKKTLVYHSLSKQNIWHGVHGFHTKP